MLSASNSITTLHLPELLTNAAAISLAQIFLASYYIVVVDSLPTRDTLRDPMAVHPFSWFLGYREMPLPRQRLLLILDGAVAGGTQPIL